MYQEQTFVDDIQFSNAVGGSQLQDLREGAGNRTSLVGIELLDKENIKIQDYSTLQGSNTINFVKKIIAGRAKDLARLNTLFGRLKYETNSLQRDAIIKEIEPLREQIKNSIKDFDRISRKLRGQLFVDLSKPIVFVSIGRETGIPENVNPIRRKPLSPTTPTVPTATPQTGSGIVVAPPFDPRNVMQGQSVPTGGGAVTEEGGAVAEEGGAVVPKETEKKPSNTKFILLGLGALAVVYYFFIRKKS